MTRDDAHCCQWDLQEGKAIIYKYCGDFYSNSKEEPYASEWSFCNRLEKLIEEDASPRIALIQGYVTEDFGVVIGTKLLPYEGIALPDASKKTIKDRVDFLYETFAGQAHVEDQEIIGFVIDNPEKLETSIKIHSQFQENYLAKGPFHALDEPQFAKDIISWIKARFEYYKNIFSWN